MYLTRMELDLTKRKTLMALSTPSVFHGTVESAFPGERKRNLWRIDSLNKKKYLMILSEAIPNLTETKKQFGMDEEEWLSRNYESFLKRVQNETVWQFRLTANPTYCEKKDGEKRGRIHAHITAEHQREWLIRQSKKYGFCLQNDMFDVVSSRWYTFSKGIKGKRIHMLSVTFEGILKVTDEDAFREMLINGLGREKAYGVGLMTLMQPRR